MEDELSSFGAATEKKNTKEMTPTERQRRGNDRDAPPLATRGGAVMFFIGRFQEMFIGSV